jgi:hypothetical protein
MKTDVNMGYLRFASGLQARFLWIVLVNTTGSRCQPDVDVHQLSGLCTAKQEHFSLALPLAQD